MLVFRFNLVKFVLKSYFTQKTVFFNTSCCFLILIVKFNFKKLFGLDEEFADEFEAGIEDTEQPESDKKTSNGEKKLDIKPLTFANVTF